MLRIINYLSELKGKYLIWKYKRLDGNVVIEDGLKVFCRLKIVGKGKLHIGKNCVIDGVRGDKSQYVTLYTQDRSAEITIGDNVRLYAARITSTFSITIGDETLIEESGIADSDFHSIDRTRTTPPADENLEKCRIVIGKRVAIGSKSIVSKGTQIGDDAIICPGSVVSRSIPPASLASGNPARVIRKQI